jgi:nicotinamide-nucleotide amidase
MSKPENYLAAILTQKRLSLSVAESCTGGFVSNRLTNVAGSSKYFKLGLVTYSNKTKQSILKVPAELIKRNGAVSKQVAIQMARGVRKLSKTDLSLGITGIAGPGGATKNKPVGLVFIACASKNKTVCKKYNFNGSRLSIKKQTSQAALGLLNKYIRETIE